MRWATGALSLLLASSAVAADEAATGASPQPSASQQERQTPPLSDEQSAALLSIPGGPYSRDGGGRVIDGRSGRPVTPEEAEAALALLRARSSPDTLGAVLPAMEASPRLYFPHLDEEQARAAAERLSTQLRTREGRLSAAGQRALALASSGPGEARDAGALSPQTGLAAGALAGAAGGDSARLAQEAAAVPRSRRPASLRTAAAPPPLGPTEQVAGLTRDVDRLYDQFDRGLIDAGAPTLGQGWIGNLLYRYTCQNMHDGFRSVIERQDWQSRYPGVQFVGLYQPGVYPRISEGYRNHIFIGVVQDGRVTHYFDPWRRQGMTPYTGQGDLPLSRDWLEVRPWDGSGSYRVDDQGRRIR